MWRSPHIALNIARNIPDDLAATDDYARDNRLIRENPTPARLKVRPAPRIFGGKRRHPPGVAIALVLEKQRQIRFRDSA